jgi:hypothetical protein
MALQRSQCGFPCRRLDARCSPPALARLQFVLKLFELVAQLLSAASTFVPVGILALVDLTLVAKSILIVICANYRKAFGAMATIISIMQVVTVRITSLLSMISPAR